jgi:hypothetical protein
LLGSRTTLIEDALKTAGVAAFTVWAVAVSWSAARDLGEPRAVVDVRDVPGRPPAVPSTPTRYRPVATEHR